MTPSPKNQPTFHISTIGNLNTGDVTIHGDQIGTQNNHAAEPEVKSTIARPQTNQTRSTPHPLLLLRPQRRSPARPTRPPPRPADQTRHHHHLARSRHLRRNRMGRGDRHPPPHRRPHPAPDQRQLHRTPTTATTPKCSKLSSATIEDKPASSPSCSNPATGKLPPSANSKPSRSPPAQAQNPSPNGPTQTKPSPKLPKASAKPPPT